MDSPKPANVDEPIGDDVPCSACGEVALDTGWECTECGHDMMPELFPQKAMPAPGLLQ